jgi:head-tail adaptor
MLKFNRLDTAIRIQAKTTSTNGNGFPVEIWTDIIDEDILCDWRNKYGVESWQAASVKAREPASVRFWYLPGVTPECRVVRCEDQAFFDIVNVDDVQNRHQQIELELQRRVGG